MIKTFMCEQSRNSEKRKETVIKRAFKWMNAVDVNVRNSLRFFLELNLIINSYVTLNIVTHASQCSLLIAVSFLLSFVENDISKRDVKKFRMMTLFASCINNLIHAFGLIKINVLFFPGSKKMMDKVENWRKNLIRLRVAFYFMLSNFDTFVFFSSLAIFCWHTKFFYIELKVENEDFEFHPIRWNKMALTWRRKKKQMKL